MKPRPCFLFRVLLSRSSLLLQLHTNDSIQTSALFFSVLNTPKLWGEAGGGKNAQSKLAGSQQEPTSSEPFHHKNKGAEEKIGPSRGILVGS